VIEQKTPSIDSNFEINLKDVTYTYPGSQKASSKNLNINIPYKSFIGFAGESGSGKTTAADIIAGLISPSSGSLSIGNIKIDSCHWKYWHGLLGYVPQDICLINGSIIENIALGIDSARVDFEKILYVSRLANIESFVDELPNKFNTIIGERGSTLSGGQIQRIGIARALYQSPKLLIIDEGTSALDLIAERKILKSFEDIKKDCTIIVIAHRVNTLKACDSIYLFEKGEITSHGTYMDLISKSLMFNRIAK